MRIVYFTHSLLSCWNHGNAHFLRGVLRELGALGHEVVALEPLDSWSLSNLTGDHGEAGLEAFRKAYPQLHPQVYSRDADLFSLLHGADVVIVHEWNEPALVAAIGLVRRGSDFKLLFHDTHHRAVSDPEAIRAFDLTDYDGVLAFGEALSEVYRRWGWGERVWTWHEAADLRHFHPPAQEGERKGLVWIGNWGDGERTSELEHFLFRPAEQAELPLDIYGVRYPTEALAMLERHGARYHGWAANAAAPSIFSRYLATVHVPRRYYTRMLPGIPTIRVFEALACGVPLVCSPWEDSEGLFRPGKDFLVAKDSREMFEHLRAIAADADLRDALVRSGLETVWNRHGCAHRARELLAIVDTLSCSPAISEEHVA
ncbi:glycosyltransferase [Sphingobium sp. BHU LFT2]|uniref:CgeB family protein n=1 Tax=Sphingobium sp. BHU LFT2 TaxID=2807634 RepID=UPI001BE4F653|nr:glycosyltransferase [Sphingobium sp. BHU LFT2]MBT2245064.1 glycosyltransferase [Sphingobium sp. BHU LFT2]